MLMEIIIFLFTLILIYHVYMHKRIHYYFEKKGIKYIPGIPLFGNTLASSCFKKHMVEDLDTVYKAFPDEKYVGYIEGATPIIMIRDPELIKNIAVKDFEYFVNHKEFFPEEWEPLFDGSLFMMKGDRWRDMRTKLSPAFTGSKMRQMMICMVESTENLVQYLKGHLSEVIDVENLMRRYTNDVIGTAGFGLQINSVQNENNALFQTGQGHFQCAIKHKAYYFFGIQFPDIAKRIKKSVTSAKITEVFKDLVSETMDYRTKNNVERPDMIQRLVEAAKGALKNNEIVEKDNVDSTTADKALNAQKWNKEDFAAQTLIFYIGGFESTSITLIMCIHELALNPEVQEKLYQEIKAFQESQKSLTFENIGDLKYLNCVLNETSRKWAVPIRMDRVCLKTYELPPSREGSKPCLLKPGDIVYNMVNSLHMDAKHFPEPDIFDPDRFSDENKDKIKPFTFMPFGVGPRSCLGTRFAVLAMKVVLFSLILNYKIVKCEKTADPIRLKPTDFNIKADGGSWVKFQARNLV